jgi:hypothetical protein
MSQWCPIILQLSTSISHFDIQSKMFFPETLVKQIALFLKSEWAIYLKTSGGYKQQVN